MQIYYLLIWPSTFSFYGNLPTNLGAKTKGKNLRDGGTGDPPYSADNNCSLTLFPIPTFLKFSSLSNSSRINNFLSTAVDEGNDVLSEKGECNSDDLDDDDFVDAEEDLRQVDDGEALEPYVGMEFQSEDDARRFYNDYARRLGFTVRIMQCRRSEVDGRTLARRLGCNKQGFSPNSKGKTGKDRKPRPRAREGCKASILFKADKSGKWVVTRFVKEHTHPLTVVAQECMTLCDKDKKIQELTAELQRQEELRAAYRERLINLLSTVENQNEQFSSKILAVVQSVRKAEAEALSISGA